MRSFIFLLLVNTIFELGFTYKVLVFNPTFGASHSNFLGKISDILIDAGHNVTMLIPVFMKEKKDLVGSKKVKNVIRIEQDPRIAELLAESKADEVMRKDIWRKGSNLEIFVSMVTTFSLTSGYQCENIFRRNDLIQQLRSEKFDLGISESLFICGHALFDQIGVKSVINADSILMMDAVKYSLGEPASTSFYPGLLASSWNINNESSIFERAKNLGAVGVLMWFSSTRHKQELSMIQPYYNGTRSWDEHLSRISFNMINSNQYLDYPSPVLPKTVFIGGIQVASNQNSKSKLSQEWEDILNKRQKNVLISFGSKTFSSDMPDEFKNAFLEVFASMPDTTFIWKYEVANATIVDHLPNVKLTTWMPQSDLLADDRLNVFVTHGGLGSIMELAYQGKPAIVIPVMGDQPRNAHMLTRHGGAIRMNKNELDDPKKIRKKIETILNDESYAENARRLADILESQPNKPKDNVLKHCDFAVKFGNLETLSSSGRHLNTIQYYSIDIVIVLILLISAIVIVLFSFIQIITKFAIRKISAWNAKINKID